MNRESLIQNIGNWLIDQALDEPDILALFDQLCIRLYGIGIPVKRARLSWPMLHPLFQAETLLWRRDEVIEFEQFNHQDQLNLSWQQSPMAYMMANELTELRRNLDGPNKLLDFSILNDFVAQGLTDYLAIATSFAGKQMINNGRVNGIIVTWSTDRSNGFSDDDIRALKRIQRRFAAAVKNTVQQRIALNITQTYLGNHASTQVLDGAIKLGDGRDIQAVVWYSDMRSSTKLAEQMPPDEYLKLLNDYFQSTAGAVIAQGGEVLDFIGDAVLAIFPYDDDESKQEAVLAATKAMQDSLRLSHEKNEHRHKQGKITFAFGIGMNSGRVVFGNIGVPTRLSFSVIGPAISEVERIETMTKTINGTVLCTADIAAAAPQLWSSIGKRHLRGITQEFELFGLNEQS